MAGKVYNGRKFRMGLYCLLTITAGLAIASLVVAVSPLYPTFVAAVTGVYAVYCGGNVGHKAVESKKNTPQGESGTLSETFRG